MRRRIERKDAAAAAVTSAAVAVGVGAILYYFLRVFLSREPLPERLPESTDVDGD